MYFRATDFGTLRHTLVLTFRTPVLPRDTKAGKAWACRVLGRVALAFGPHAPPGH